jgi:hypothetical protein
MPGLGQAYVGYYRVAFVYALTAAGSIAVMSMDPGEPLLPLLPLFLAFFWLYNIIDAGRRAALYNYAMEGGAGIDLPQGGIPIPGAGGSLATGLVLVVGGAILLSYTRFGYSLAWLEEWWPLVPIAFGVWLVARGIIPTFSTPAPTMLECET